MAPKFKKEKSKVPSAIGDVGIVITDSGGITNIEYEIQILDLDGTVFNLAYGDAIPYMNPGQINAINSFMSSFRTKAQELLTD